MSENVSESATELYLRHVEDSKESRDKLKEAGVTCLVRAQTLNALADADLAAAKAYAIASNPTGWARGRGGG